MQFLHIISDVLTFSTTACAQYLPVINSFNNFFHRVYPSTPFEVKKWEEREGIKDKEIINKQKFKKIKGIHQYNFFAAKDLPHSEQRGLIYYNNIYVADPSDEFNYLAYFYRESKIAMAAKSSWVYL